MARWWLVCTCLLACGPGSGTVESLKVRAAPEDLGAHCRDAIGQPRVEEVSPGVYLAIGYDLANTILIATEDGNIVVDTSMSPARARAVR